MNSGIVSQYIPQYLDQYVDYFLFCEDSGVNTTTLFYPIPQILNETMIELNKAIVVANGTDAEKYLQASKASLLELTSLVQTLLDCEVTSNAYDQVRSATCVQLLFVSISCSYLYFSD